MSSNITEENHTASVVKSLIAKEHKITIFSKEMAYAIDAEVIDLDLSSGRLSLQVSYDDGDLGNYLMNGMISFDVESNRWPDEHDKEVCNFEKIKAQLLKRDIGVYEIKCQLPDSVFVNENRGAIRVPFILGMSARAGVEVFTNELNIEGSLRNLSVGGCMVDITIEDSLSLSVNQDIPGVSLEFPNGQYFHSKGRIRHIRPFGSSGHAAVGIQFIDLPSTMEGELFHFVTESEREAASRSGVNMRGAGPSRLFIAGDKEKRLLQREQMKKKEAIKMPPVVKGIMEVAQQLQVILMFIKNRSIFPEDTLYDCVDTIIYQVKQDRKGLLYALSFLSEQPEWVRHAVQVAAMLADMLHARDPHSGRIRESIVGALLHTMGKPLLISERLPSLKINMSPSQRNILKGHTASLIQKVTELGWKPSSICLDVIANANECLDGSGYPAGKNGDALSDLARLVAVIKVINKLTHERNGVTPRSPLNAYRWVNDNPQKYDKTELVEYIQQYGLYPIGSLAKYSGNFLAWIMDVDERGMPNKVQVVKNLAFKEASLDTVLPASDFMQIGKLEGIVNPNDYNIHHKQSHR